MKERRGKSAFTSFVKWCRWIHRHCSYFFAGVVLIYALSGILMNHRQDINPNYSAKRVLLEEAISSTPRAGGEVSLDEVMQLLGRIGEEKNYTKHYFPDEKTMKVFLKGGSTLEVDLASGKAVYDQLRKRPLLSDFVRLHYNPGRWWTYFSDLFAVALILITLTGLFLVRGRKGLKGVGGIELIAGILIPILFLVL